MAAQKERPVLVCTEFKGVFFGYATNTKGDVIHLRRARNCIYCDSKTGGFVGLAEKGPGEGCRIGAMADLELRKITCVAEVTPTAEKAWVGAPCAGATVCYWRIQVAPAMAAATSQ